MAAVVRVSVVIIDRPNRNPAVKALGFSGRITANGCQFAVGLSSLRQSNRRESSAVTCSASNGPSSSEISSTAKIRSEVLSPFRTLRLFFYLAFIASGSLGGLIAISRLIGALANPSRAGEVPEILKDLGIDFGAVSIFAFLYYTENNAKNAQVARLSREENLSNLKLRIDEKSILPLSAFRGIARLIILAGPGSFIEESFRLSEFFSEALLERGVLVVPFPTDGSSPKLEFEDSAGKKEINNRRKRLWQLAPVYAVEWTRWLDEQKKLANIPSESPVYLSLRLDGRVRGSGVGYPPWNAFVMQLPPVKGIWSGLLDVHALHSATRTFKGSKNFSPVQLAFHCPLESRSAIDRYLKIVSYL